MNPTEFKIAQIRAGVSKEDLAKELCINPTTVYRIFNGESDFTLSELKVLKKVLKLSNEDVDRIFLAMRLRKRKTRPTPQGMRKEGEYKWNPSLKRVQ